MNFRVLTFASALGLGAGLALPARAQVAQSDVLEFAGLVQNYNLLTFGNANLSLINNDTEGPLAVGGNLSISGTPLVNFSQFETDSNPTLYVAGSLVINSNMTAMLNNGYASLPGMAGVGTWNSTNQRYTTPTADGGGILSTTNAFNASDPLAGDDPRTNPPPSGWNFSTIKSNSVAVSDSLAGIASSGTITVSNNNLNFNANGNTGVVVFTLNASLLSGNTYNGSSSFSNINISIPKGTDFVVNVINASGKTIFGTGSGVNFNTPGGTAGASGLLWNIVNTGSSDITTTLGNGGQFYGSVLAPLVNLANATNAPLNGQVEADTINYANAQLNFTGFVAIPEPGYGSAVAAGLAAAAAVAAFRRRKIAA